MAVRSVHGSSAFISDTTCQYFVGAHRRNDVGGPHDYQKRPFLHAGYGAHVLDRHIARAPARGTTPVIFSRPNVTLRSSFEDTPATVRSVSRISWDARRSWTLAAITERAKLNTEPVAEFIAQRSNAPSTHQDELGNRPQSEKCGVACHHGEAHGVSRRDTTARLCSAGGICTRHNRNPTSPLIDMPS